MSDSPSPAPTPENPEEPNVSYGCCLAAVRPIAAMLLLFAAPRPDITAGPTSASQPELSHPNVAVAGRVSQVSHR